jgi:hypothetical protein
MEVTTLGKLIFNSELHPSKALSSIIFVPLDIFIVDRLVHPLNASSGIVKGRR